jgi:hypothetical protein
MGMGAFAGTALALPKAVTIFDMGRNAIVPPKVDYLRYLTYGIPDMYLEGEPFILGLQSPAPRTATNGELFMDLRTGSLFVYTGHTWAKIAAS